MDFIFTVCERAGNGTSLTVVVFIYMSFLSYFLETGTVLGHHSEQMLVQERRSRRVKEE